MKKIDVVAAIIVKDDKIFVTQRGYGEFKSQWEFPGGKIEKNEDEKEALKREIKEELNGKIEIVNHYLNTSHDYPNFSVNLRFYICNLVDEEIELLEHEDAKWIKREDLSSLNWLDGEREVVEKLKQSWI